MYLFEISSNTYVDSVYVYMDPSSNVCDILAVYSNSVVDGSNILADDSMDHVHSNRQETEEQAHIDVSF
jgi:hypothetical protein